MRNLEFAIIYCVIFSNNITSPALDPLVKVSVFNNSSNLFKKKSEISIENFINE